MAWHQREGPSTLHSFSNLYGYFCLLKKIIWFSDKQFSWSCCERRCKHIPTFSNSLSLPSQTLFLHAFKIEALFQPKLMAIKDDLPFQKWGNTGTNTLWLVRITYWDTQAPGVLPKTVVWLQLNPNKIHLPEVIWTKERQDTAPQILSLQFLRGRYLRRR